MDKIESGYVMGSHTHEEAGSRNLDAPLLRLDLAKELEELQSHESWSTRSQNAKTLAKYPDLRVVLIVLKRGVRLGEHQTKGRASIHTVQGHIAVKVAEQEVDLPAGCLLELGPCVPHDVEAKEDSSILLTIAWPPGNSTQPQP